MTRRWAVILIAASASTDLRAEEGSFYIFNRAESFSYSEGSPATAFPNLLVGPAPDGGDTAFSRNRFELGFGYKKFELSFVHRNDYNLNFSPDAALFAYQNKNRVAIPLGQEYEVDVWANQYQMSGAKASYQFDLSEKFSFTLSYSQLWGTEAVSGTFGKDANGDDGVIKMVESTMNGVTRKIIDGTLHTDYFYTDDPFFEREVDAPTGYGYAVDLGFRWDATENVSIEGVVQDLAGEMRWDDMPHTTAIARSDVIVVNEDGFLEANPNFAGVEGFGNFTQEFTRRAILTTTYRWNKMLFGYQYEGYEVADFSRLIVGYHWSERWAFDVATEVNTSAVDLRLGTPIGFFSVTTDDTDLDNAHTLGLSWNLEFRF